MFGKKKSKDDQANGNFDSPLEEVTHLLDKLESIISETNDSYIKSIRPPSAEDEAKANRNSLVSPFKNFGRKGEEVPAKPAKTSSKPSKHFKFQEKSKKEKDAKYIPMSNEEVEGLVEIIRRISELVIFAERGSSAQSPEMRHGDIALFDYFFERNGLALMTDIVTGVSFDLQAHRDKQKKALDLDESPRSDDLKIAEDMLQGFDFDLSEHDYMLLPPLAIATQAIQSVSILVQNVKRATSLFFILSNNHINQLINFPLEQYRISDRKRHNQNGDGLSPRRQGSPELAELTTNFVAFLKSLALRMNVDTLQFYLTYPQENAAKEETLQLDEPPVSNSNPQETDDQPDDEDCPMDEIVGNATNESPETESSSASTVEMIKVEFPLYERALEFCSAHQDSFVRLTAMNICLNTLRLSTVRDDDENAASSNGGSATPDAVLHNAKALPTRERLAIAQFVCSPTRVEKLTSPIFTKLAQLWGILEEQFRDMDTIPGLRKLLKKEAVSKTKTEKAKITAKRQKVSNSFKDTAANIQDELLLLEDLLRVGLTTLNEQTIEMMFATFVYPLLLQPLLLYFQRTTLNDTDLYADPIKDYCLGRNVKASDMTAGENPIISAPAKSAFFSLAAVFQFITNPPLLRLLFTALFHPLAPGATGETMIVAEPEVSSVDSNGNIYIRIDPLDRSGQMITETGRSSYDFGALTGQQRRSGSFRYSGNSDGRCAYVLSPILAEILQFKGNDGALVARTRNNPYRKAIFQCFTLSNQLSDLQPFSVLAVDSAFSIFDKEFLVDILFGIDMKKFQENNEASPIISESQLAQLDDRDIGGSGIGIESRLSLGGYTGVDFMNEVLSSFESCLVKAVPGGDGLWKLEYDMVAAHALLCVIEGSPEAQVATEKGVSNRSRQAAQFLSSIPQSMEHLKGSSLRPKHDALQNNDKNEIYRGVILNRMFGYTATSTDSLLNHTYWLKSDRSQHFISVSGHGSYNVLCGRSCAFPPVENDGFTAALRNAISGSRAWASLNAFCTVLRTAGTTKGASIRQAIVGGCALKQDGTAVPTYKTGGVTHAPISLDFAKSLFEEDRTGNAYVKADPGTVVSLVGRTALPCVCEVPPSCAPLFSEAGAKVVSQGITWQSLYLVILGWNLVLAEPERKSSGDGRVVMCCRLEDLVLEKDNDDLPASTSARRLIVSHDGPGDKDPPGLFLFDKTPELKEEGPFIKVQKWRSSVDIWFENEKALHLCFEKVDKMCTMAKAHRGHLVQDYLKSGE